MINLEIGTQNIKNIRKEYMELYQRIEKCSRWWEGINFSKFICHNIVNYLSR
jgi:hypothetical protein